MKSHIPAPVLERMARPAPRNMEVIEGSLPVTSFGNPFTASVATVSLNPSWLEFLNRKGAWLEAPNHRLESLHTLKKNATNELTDEDLVKAVDKCNNYFDGNPYKAWFNQLNVINKVFEADYYTGSACHLDLVQWATRTVQKNLGDKWKPLVEADKDFLAWQLKTTTAKTILMNGTSTVNALVNEALVPDLIETNFTYIKSNGHRGSWRVFHGRNDDQLFVGWSGVVAQGIPSAVREDFFNLLKSLTC